jgi:hypothetical protein
MMPKLPVLIFLVGAWNSATAQQHAGRPVKSAGAGPVGVTRSATMQPFVSSDAVSVFGYLYR